MPIAPRCKAGPDDESRFVLAGDNVYAYESLGGLDGSGHYLPVGPSIDSYKGVATIDQIMKIVENRPRSIIPVHEYRRPRAFPLESRSMDCTSPRCT